MKPHETDHSPPLAENTPPHRKGVSPPLESDPSRAPRRAPSTATGPFKAAYQAAFGTPSGELTWAVKVSQKPSEWFYSGSENPGESFGLSSPNASHCKTDAHIAACISWQWAGEKTADERWRISTAGLTRKTIALGAVPITKLPEPADEGWIIYLVCSSNGTYTGQFRKMVCLFLGNHWTLAPFFPQDHTAAAASLIEKVRRASIDRMRPQATLNQWPSTVFQPWNIKL